MDDCRLQPWMLRQDWREDRRLWLLADLAAWPADEPLGPLPPVPVIAIGPASHPQAARADLLIEPPITLTALKTGIAGAPLAAATVVQLLRATEGLAQEQALPLESFAMAMLQGSAEHAAWLARQPPTPMQQPSLPNRTLDLRRDGNQLHVLLDRPEARNAIDRTTRDALYDAFTVALLDPDIQRVRLRARGRCFSLGADLAEFGVTRDPAAAHAIRMRALPTHLIAQRPELFDIHVQGACVGAGLEMAAFAGRFTAAPGAWFQLPETGMGILPGFGGCVSLPRRIGRQRAAALMLSGKRIGATTALRWGLIDAIVDEPAAD